METARRSKLLSFELDGEATIGVTVLRKSV